MTAATSSMPIFNREAPPVSVVRSASSQTQAAADMEASHISSGIARGDEGAFQKLYDAYNKRLFLLALSLGAGDSLLANEVVQSVFLAAAGKLRPVKSELHLWNWLARVARQQLAKSWRHRRQVPAMENLDDLPNVADQGQNDSLLEEGLNAALLELDAKERQLIELFYFEGLSHKEIARRLLTSPKAISSVMERARARLRVLVAKKISHET